jgi:hypothetical protein
MTSTASLRPNDLCFELEPDWYGDQNELLIQSPVPTMRKGHETRLRVADGGVAYTRHHLDMFGVRQAETRGLMAVGPGETASSSEEHGPGLGAAGLSRGCRTHQGGMLL